MAYCRARKQCNITRLRISFLQDSGNDRKEYLPPTSVKRWKQYLKWYVITMMRKQLINIHRGNKTCYTVKQVTYSERERYKRCDKNRMLQTSLSKRLLSRWQNYQSGQKKTKSMSYRLSKEQRARKQAEFQVIYTGEWVRQDRGLNASEILVNKLKKATVMKKIVLIV